MARVVMQAVVSVDGFIAYPDDSVGPLFDWYGNGDTTIHANDKWSFTVSAASAAYLRPFWDAVKVTVIGRHLFDTTDGWQGVPAAGEQLVVVTHRPLPEEWLARFPDAPFHTAGSIEEGISLAKRLAGDDGLVCVTAGDVGGQAFTAGLVDEVAMDVVPVVLGEGVRFFGAHTGTVLLDDPDAVVQGDRVLHLHFKIKP